jgi:hypothetical protein
LLDLKPTGPPPRMAGKGPKAPSGPAAGLRRIREAAGEEEVPPLAVKLRGIYVWMEEEG